MGRNITREPLAFLIAPAFPSVFFLLTAHTTDAMVALVILIFSLPFSYLPSLFFGLPLVSYLRKRGRLNIANLLWAGAILGAGIYWLAAFAITAALGSSPPQTADYRILLTGAALGLTVALLFGLIAGYPLFQAPRR